MKRISLCISLVILSVTAYAQPQPQPQSQPTVECSKLDIESGKITDSTTDYSIEIDYPKFSSSNPQCKLTNLKSIIRNLVIHDRDDFISQLPKTSKTNKNLKSTLSLDYNVYFNSRGLVSLRFSSTEYFIGQAHPMTFFNSITYDLRKDRLLSLKDFFNDSNYLTQISNETSRVLKERLKNGMVKQDVTDNWVEEGTAPTEKNYQIWNLTSQGILFTFAPYKVAPYAQGSPEVLIPEATLEKSSFNLPENDATKK